MVFGLTTKARQFGKMLLKAFATRLPINVLPRPMS